jgi:transcriptional regulator with XRE-family HTH domain|tara:strand:+ start:2723 stop:2935 length:213 start_codon:yes stop_codon:yes gene_type:complete
MTTIDLRFGKRVRSVRSDQKISQEQLAYLAKIDRGHMGNIERGSVSPTLKKINQIAMALDVSVQSLLEGA